MIGFGLDEDLTFGVHYVLPHVFLDLIWGCTCKFDLLELHLTCIELGWNGN